MAEKFNADFYVTCATVIPVLFLAAAVQGQAFVFLLQRARRSTPGSVSGSHSGSSGSVLLPS